MKLTLVEIVEAIDSKADLDSLELSVEEEVLAASFVHERLERPVMLGLVVEHEELLTRYLRLPAEQRALLEGLRAKRPEYLGGDYNSEPAINSSNKTPRPFTSESWKLYKDTHNTKSIARIITHYTNKPPTNTYGRPVSPTAYFQSYDPHTNTNLTPYKDGKKTTHNTQPGNKYYQQWRTQQQKQPNTPDFETWITNQLTPELREQLLQTPYYQQPKTPDLTIQQIIQHYTNNQPTNPRGRPVPLQAYFKSYDSQTGNNLRPTKDGKKTTLATAPGNKYYQQWRTQQQKQPYTPNFDNWVIAQIPDELKSELLQTPYFLAKNKGDSS